MSVPRDHFVYWLFDSYGQCIYIGITRQPEQRWKAHCRRFGDEVASKRMAGPYTPGTARRVEREQQDLLHPKYDARQQRLRAQRLLAEQPQQRWVTYSIPTVADLIKVPEEVLRKITGPHVKYLQFPEEDPYEVAS